MIQYDGRSLVPDLTNSLNLALGLAGQVKQKRQDQQALDMAGQIIDNPENAETNQKILAQLSQLDPDLAKHAGGIIQSRDQAQIREAEQMARDSGAFFASLEGMDEEAQNQAILARGRELLSQGQDISKLESILGLTGDERQIAIKQRVLSSGFFEEFVKRNDPFTLSENQQRFDGEGNLVASNEAQATAADRKTAKDAEGVLRYVDDNTAVFAQDEQKLAEDKAAVEKQQAAELSALQDQAAIVQTEIGRALELLPETMAGRRGEAAAKIKPSGKNAELRRTIETIKANIGFDKLMEMRRNSPTGGALGNVSEKELYGLQAVLGNLDAQASDEDLSRALMQVKSFYDKLSLGSEQDLSGMSDEDLLNF